ncbi:hypothetical protein M8J75_004304 [Diaphorina citri]|nr:hypothetical protein M8J75_004304 [Diaphorina citri]
MKYILVTGGVMSGVGKGVIASSFGLLLKNCGIKVTAIKIDPYINIDAGTFSPYEHGEVYVLEDGAEVDLDLGNYERFLDITLHKDNNITTGKIYQKVIDEERKGSYLGKTVQVVPHITNAIQEWVEKVSQVPVSPNGEIPEVCIVELGGTIGDIEGMAFVEAFRQFQFRVGVDNFCCVHVAPLMESKNEFKTKPTQATVRELRGLGLSPDLVVCRSQFNPMDDTESVRAKISMFCHVTPENVIFNPDVKPIYKVPLILEKQGVLHFFRERLKLVGAETQVKEMKMWKRFTEKIDRLNKTVTIGLVGKYTKFEDCYASLTRALEHASYHSNRHLQLKYFDSELLSMDPKTGNMAEYHKTWSDFCKVDGIIVPGGFGKRGLEGKIAACKWARENNKPFLGICLGLQAAVIEYGRSVLGLKDADTEEEQPPGQTLEHPVVVYMPEHNPGNMGGTMRLGKHETHFKPEHKSKLKLLYGNKDKIEERHRHRYEVNKKYYVPDYEKHGFLFTGVDEKEVRMEIAELRDHPYYVAVQFHPEYLSRPLRPSPPFLGLILAAAGKLDAYIEKECRQVTETDDDDSDYESSDNRHKIQVSKVGSTNKLPSDCESC